MQALIARFCINTDLLKRVVADAHNLGFNAVPDGASIGARQKKHEKGEDDASCEQNSQATSQQPVKPSKRSRDFRNKVNQRTKSSTALAVLREIGGRVITPTVIALAPCHGSSIYH